MCICIHSVSVRLDCEDLAKKSKKNLSIFIDLYGSVSRDLTGKFSYPDNAGAIIKQVGQKAQFPIT
jgi:hypothetical protein